MLQLIKKNASEDHLTFQRPVFTYANAQRKTPLEIIFIVRHQGNLLHF